MYINTRLQGNLFQISNFKGVYSVLYMFIKINVKKRPSTLLIVTSLFNIRGSKVHQYIKINITQQSKCLCPFIWDTWRKAYTRTDKEPFKHQIKNSFNVKGKEFIHHLQFLLHHYMIGLFIDNADFFFYIYNFN